MIKVILIWCAVALAFFLIVAVFRAAFLVSVSLKIQEKTVAYSRILPEAETKVLFLGDSTALGTGAEQPEFTVAGRLAAEVPEASIENESRNGLKTKELLENVRNREWLKRYSLIVIQIGGNDILRFTDRGDLTADIEAMLSEATSRADAVVLLTSGDVGRAPFFTYPIGKLWNAQTRAVREIFMKAAAKNGVHYVDLYSADVDETFEKDIAKYYSDDRLHPRGAGYAIWYGEARKTLQETSFNGFFSQ